MARGRGGIWGTEGISLVESRGTPPEHGVGERGSGQGAEWREEGGPAGGRPMWVGPTPALHSCFRAPVPPSFAESPPPGSLAAALELGAKHRAPAPSRLPSVSPPRSASSSGGRVTRAPLGKAETGRPARGGPAG